MNKKSLLRLVPFLFTLHNLKEAWSMPSFLEKRDALLPEALRPFAPHVAAQEFLVALLVITVIPYLFLAFGEPERAREKMRM